MTLLRPYLPKKRHIPLTSKHEQTLQKQVCQYLRLRYPNLIFRSDFASGLHLTMNQAAIHKSLQSGRSFPDLFIYKMSRGYGGLGLELKRENTAIYVSRGSNKGELVADTHVREQAMMLAELNRQGYFARFGVGFDQTVRIIEWYMNPDYKDSENGELF